MADLVQKEFYSMADIANMLGKPDKKGKVVPASWDVIKKLYDNGEIKGRWLTGGRLVCTREQIMDFINGRRAKD